MPMASTTAQPTIERPPMAARVRPWTWLRNNLFRTVLDTILSLLVALFLVFALSRFFQWAISEAQWAVVTENFRVLMQGLYPVDQGWRVALCGVIVMLLAGISWGLWGRLARNTAIGLLAAVILIIALPLAGSLPAGEGDFGHYLSDQLIPLFQVLRLPVMILSLCLAVGYGIGRA